MNRSKAGWTEPEYQDDVKNRHNEYSGRVIAKFVVNGTTYLDVRCGDRVFYGSPATNWETLTKEVDRCD